ncbi:hypothetical protein SmJEL517_g01006 [Synchytrium microbalum]|uniref:Gamma-glutamyltransferase n=1 Tax=Synchytrium microbalum TaxID=1806994 RepID=A0A507CHC1_9FUNG|nr:uncharacterized protein SmJEL517_g01006 [Synchytrium microbalum]TPX36963.1 hypothetical protein SmJEL517_g01006 [Synchytrium microbalum]
MEPSLDSPYGPSRHPQFIFNSRRSPVYSTKGLVCASQPLAVNAGLKILQMGGNAVDACVAVAAAMNVTEPHQTGIGGDMFLLYYNAKTKIVKGLNGTGRAPAALSLAKAHAMGYTTEIPFTDVNACTVPGAAAGWCDSVQHFGSGKVSMQDILQPAIDLAENGYPVSPISSFIWAVGAGKLRTGSKYGGELLIDNRAPRAGEIMSMPELAETFRTVAREGKKGFYEGRIAEAIVNTIRENGGLMTLEDLKSHTSTLVDPVSINYKGVIVHEIPPSSQGIVALIALGILESLWQDRGIDFKTLGHNSPEYLHYLIEALRLAFSDARQYIADPAIVPVPSKGLLDKEYLKSRANLIDPHHARADITAGSPQYSSDTVYFTVVDAEGNACSFINSLYEPFGCGAVAKGTGVALQNRGSNFSLQEGHPNVLAPGKRPYHTIIPAMATLATTSELYLSYGNMGGFMQPQGHVQVLFNMMEFGLDPQAAVDALRFCIGPFDGITWVEEGTPAATIQKLREMGHYIEVLSSHERNKMGRAQVIANRRDPRTKQRYLVGGSDPRGDGHVGAML